MLFLVPGARSLLFQPFVSFRLSLLLDMRHVLSPAPAVLAIYFIHSVVSVSVFAYRVSRASLPLIAPSVNSVFRSVYSALIIGISRTKPVSSGRQSGGGEAESIERDRIA